MKSYLVIKKGAIAETVYCLESELTIGRKGEVDIQLPDPTVSRRHATVYLEKGKPVVEDLGSANGTFVNEILVRKSPLLNGDNLRIGSIKLRFLQNKELPQGMTAKRRKAAPVRKRLGEHLMRAGVLDERTLKTALKVQQVKKKRIGQVLKEMGVADGVQIAKALASQLNIPLVRLEEIEIAKEVRSLIPAAIVKTRLLMPLRITGNRLLVAMADPLDMDVLQDLRFMTGMIIDIAVTPEEDIAATFQISFPMEALEETLDANQDVEFS
jgi:hypothetical protein